MVADLSISAALFAEFIKIYSGWEAVSAGTAEYIFNVFCSVKQLKQISIVNVIVLRFNP